MSDVLSTFVKRKYILGKGGNYSRSEDGALKTYKPGDPEGIWLTDEEAQQRSLVGRLTLVGEPTMMQSKAPTKAPVAAAPTTKSVSSSTDTPAEPVTVEPKPPATATAKRTKITDWSFVPDTLTDTLTSLIDDLDDVADLKAMMTAEKTRPNGARARVRQAITARSRQLNMAKARATRDANLAKRRAEKAAEGEGDKEQTGTE